MKQTLVTLVMICGVISSCKDGNFKKGADSLRYKIVANGEEKEKGKKPVQGEWLKIHVVQRYNDSLLSDTHTTEAQYIQYDSASMSKESYSIFGKAHMGDSLIFRVSSDSAFKNRKPAFVKNNNGFLVTYVKIENIFLTREEAMADADSSRNNNSKLQPKEEQQSEYPGR